jgi:hypothetical protein
MVLSRTGRRLANTDPEIHVPEAAVFPNETPFRRNV